MRFLLALFLVGCAAHSQRMPSSGGETSFDDMEAAGSSHIMIRGMLVQGTAQVETHWVCMSSVLNRSGIIWFMDHACQTGPTPMSGEIQAVLEIGDSRKVTRLGFSGGGSIWSADPAMKDCIEKQRASFEAFLAEKSVHDFLRDSGRDMFFIHVDDFRSNQLTPEQLRAARTSLEISPNSITVNIPVVGATPACRALDKGELLSAFSPPARDIMNLSGSAAHKFPNHRFEAGAFLCIGQHNEQVPCAAPAP